MEHPLVLIEWDDSVRPNPAWFFLSDMEEARIVKCASVGWLVAGDEKTKTLAPNIGTATDEDSLQACGVICIPARSITRMVRLEETKLETAAP